MSSTTLGGRLNDKTTSTIATTATSTFSPELNSTPPMHAVQKPKGLVTKPDDESVSTCDQSPTRIGTAAGNSDCSSLLTPTTPCSLPIRHVPKSITLPTHEEDMVGSSSLPTNWTQQHDRAICVLDARNYTLPGIVIKLRRTFPSLNGVLTTAMIDKRLRQLDQNVDIDYWRIGLRSKDGNAGLLSPPSSFIPRPNGSVALTASSPDAINHSATTMPLTASGKTDQNENLRSIVPKAYGLGNPPRKASPGPSSRSCALPGKKSKALS